MHGFNFVKKESIIKSKIFRRFYKFDYLIAINGTVNNIVSRKPKYAAPPVSAIDLQTWLSVHLLAYISAHFGIAWVFPQFKTSQLTTKTTGLALSGNIFHNKWETCWLLIMNSFLQFLIFLKETWQDVFGVNYFLIRYYFFNWNFGSNIQQGFLFFRGRN